MQIADIPTSYKKSGSRNKIVTSDFRPEVEIWPFRTCAVKNMQCNSYLWRNRRNSHVSGNPCQGIQWWRQILDRKWKYGRCKKISSVSSGTQNL